MGSSGSSNFSILNNCHYFHAFLITFNATTHMLFESILFLFVLCFVVGRTGRDRVESFGERPSYQMYVFIHEW